MEEATEKDTQEIVRYFGSDCEEKMSSQDFLQMVLPCDDEYLRASVAQRNVFQA